MLRGILFCCKKIKSGTGAVLGFGVRAIIWAPAFVVSFVKMCRIRCKREIDAERIWCTPLEALSVAFDDNAIAEHNRSSRHNASNVVSPETLITLRRDLSLLRARWGISGEYFKIQTLLWVAVSLPFIMFGILNLLPGIGPDADEQEEFQERAIYFLKFLGGFFGSPLCLASLYYTYRYPNIFIDSCREIKHFLYYGTYPLRWLLSLCDINESQEFEEIPEELPVVRALPRRSNEAAAKPLLLQPTASNYGTTQSATQSSRLEACERHFDTADSKRSVNTQSGGSSGNNGAGASAVVYVYRSSEANRLNASAAPVTSFDSMSNSGVDYHRLPSEANSKQVQQRVTRGAN